MHVLIVEGDGDAARSISQMLRKLGHTSVIAGTMAEAAVEAAPLRTPPSASVDVVIVNANLADDGAARLMPMLAELGIRGIAIANDKREWDAMKAAGFLFHLPSPVTFPDLRAVFAPIQDKPSRMPGRPRGKPTRKG
jgi:CheY-like chemotaxis protein